MLGSDPADLLRCHRGVVKDHSGSLGGRASGGILGSRRSPMNPGPMWAATTLPFRPPRSVSQRTTEPPPAPTSEDRHPSGRRWPLGIEKSVDRLRPRPAAAAQARPPTSIRREVASLLWHRASCTHHAICRSSPVCDDQPHASSRIEKHLCIGLGEQRAFVIGLWLPHRRRDKSPSPIPSL